MSAKVLITLAVVLIASRCDALRDRHFDPERLTRWRRPISILGTDPWHLVKWASFYLPMAWCCYLGYGFPWATWTAAGLWVGSMIAGWIVWGIGRETPSFWTKLFR